MNTMIRTLLRAETLLVSVLFLSASAVVAQPHPLAQRAAESELVVLAQLERTDYDYARGFPIDGNAWFSTLLTYKSPRIVERFIVKESGLKDIECYFPEKIDGEEGARYLLFLVRDPDNGWRGHPEGCAFEVLVGTDNRYALRWPQAAFGGEAGRGDDTIQALVEPMRFQGPRARIDASEQLTHQREARAETEFMRVEGTDLLPTRGIELSSFRQLIRDGLVNENGALQARERRRATTLRQALEEADRSGDG